MLHMEAIMQTPHSTNSNKHLYDLNDIVEPMMAALGDWTPRLLDTRQTATMVKKSPNSLRNERAARIGLPYIKFGRRVLYDLNDIVAYLAARKIIPGGSSGSDPEDCKVCGLALWAETTDPAGNRCPSRLNDDQKFCPVCGRRTRK
jgi:hypothetical protein